MNNKCKYCQDGIPIVRATKNIPIEVTINKFGTLSFTEYSEKGIVKRVAIQEKFCPECGRKFEGD